MDRLREKRVIITPYSPISRRLEKYLVKNYNINFLGFIDKSKEADNISKIDVLDRIDFDYIVIFSPNHHQDIYKNCLKKTSKNKLIKIDYLNNEYFLLNKNKNNFIILKNKLNGIMNFLWKRILKNITIGVDILGIKRNIHLFIAEDYVDSNIKHLYLYYLESGKKAIILTDNKNQLEELKNNNLPAIRLFSLYGYIKTAFAKIIYLDHFIIDYLEYTSEQQLKVQLWHGVGLKPIRDRSNLRYDYFISPSDWTNETNFNKVFKSKKFVNFGYPRNDVLLRKELQKNDLILCDKNIYSLIKNDRLEGYKILLYMPTFRENGFEGFPINFDKMNENLEFLKIKLYVKLHPYVLKKYFDSIKNSKNYKNIIFYNTQGDIYPILREVDILITDYSSIAYDFLFLNRPIIFFIYDYIEYIGVREECIGNKFLFDFYDYTPGDKVKTQDELILSILNNINEDKYEIQRMNIRDKFFDYIDTNSSKRIFDKVI